MSILFHSLPLVGAGGVFPTPPTKHGVMLSDGAVLQAKALSWFLSGRALPPPLRALPLVGGVAVGAGSGG